MTKQLSTMRRAIFLDKDGTLIPDIPYNCKPDLITLESNIIDGLRLLRTQGYLLIIVSNQAGLALGYFTKPQLNEATAHLKKLLAQAGVPVDAVYYCPHHPHAELPEYHKTCDCRKPSPGMLLRAAKDHHINLAGSWMIGDILNDVEAGNRAGCRSILIDNGNETEWLSGRYRIPAYVCNQVNAAALYIYKQQLIDD